MLLDIHNFIDDIYYAVALLHCGLFLSEFKLLVWDPVLCVQVFICLFFSIIFSSTFEIVSSNLIGR